jgi:hypothetical protein
MLPLYVKPQIHFSGQTGADTRDEGRDIVATWCASSRGAR